MENANGTKRPHYDMQQVLSVADKMGIKFDEFDEREFCIAVNMMYSDFCKVAKKYVSPDKELMFFADLAKEFFLTMKTVLKHLTSLPYTSTAL